MNKEKFYETMDELRYVLDDADYKLRRLRCGYFRAQSYGKTLKLAQLVTMINVLQEALENFNREDFNEVEEISI